jgi:hypothetical protein
MKHQVLKVVYVKFIAHDECLHEKPADEFSLTEDHNVIPDSLLVFASLKQA